jgi:hypothetical protein
MSNVKNLFIGIAAVLATVAGASAAHADRKMLVLLDASGSMGIQRADLQTRFDAAKARALDQIGIQAGLGLDAVAVYTFSDTTSTLQTVGGFVDPNVALATIGGLDLFTVGGGATPLAGAMCDAVDALIAVTATEKILEVASDGLENNTPAAHACAGIDSASSTPPYTPGSWQNKVLAKVNAAGIAVQIDLFDSGPITTLAARFATALDPEASLTSQARARSAFSMMAAPSAVAAEDGPPTLEQFFTEIARASGGRLTVIADTTPSLPVAGDFTGDGCIDRADAIAVARKFNRTGEPQDNATDLNLDGTTGFADYATVLTRFTPGGCGKPDPYVHREPVVCRGGQVLVIDGAAIENGGITVDARGACQIVVRNSLIVAGQNAIDIRGTALITSENSIFVGQNAVVSSLGASMLIAKNSVFHGAKKVTGAFVYVDLGGNTWEQ